MLVESLIRRKKGTSVTLGPAAAPRIYNFVATGPDPRHLCDVTDEDDLGTLLAIKEGYRLAKGATAAATKAPPPPPELTVKQQGGKTGKWFVYQGADAVSEGFASKSDADAALAAMEKSAGE
jgi:hypothetical protein